MEQLKQLEQLARDGYDRLIGLELGDMSLDGCTTKAPGDAERAGTSPVDRGKTGTQALHRGRRCRYPAEGAQRAGELPRLAAAGPDVGPAGRDRAAAQARDRAPGPRL